MTDSRGTGTPGVPVDTRLVWQPDGDRLSRRPDRLAVEEPLEIRLGGGPAPGPQVLSVTMRTPGHDVELVAGWLLAEGIVAGPGEIRSIRYCTDPDLDGEQRFNVVTADLAPAAAERAASRARLTSTTSACGVCGRASIESVASSGAGPVASETTFDLRTVLRWPSLLSSEGQPGFALTGGLHAAGLVSAAGELLVAREDVGRHNAVDKVIGWALLTARGADRVRPAETGLVVSGRSSFEIVEKAVRFGLPVVAGVSAASSLAARLADAQGLCLVGFVRNGSGTVYTHPERLTLSGPTG